MSSVMDLCPTQSVLTTFLLTMIQLSFHSGVVETPVYDFLH